jgi:hypothetical protein
MARQKAQPRTDQTRNRIIVDLIVNPLKDHFADSLGLVKGAREQVPSVRLISSLYRKLMPKPIRVLARASKILELFREVLQLAISDFPNNVRKEVLLFIFYKSEVEAGMESSFLGGLLESVQATERVRGDIIEFGTFKGGSTLMISHLLKKIGSKKRIFACDTFKGHPYDDKFTASPPCKGEFSNTSARYVLNKFRRFGVQDKITVVKGLFENTLLAKLANERFSLAFIDCDLYDSTKFALNFLRTRMNNGGRIVLHDYDDDRWGATKAINEWCQNNHYKVNLDPVPHVKFSHP